MGDHSGCVAIKPLVVPQQARSLLVDVDASLPGASCTVELDLTRKRVATPSISDGADSVPIAGTDSNASLVSWLRRHRGGGPPPREEPFLLASLRGHTVQLSFHLRGGAALYGFRLV